MGFVRIVKSGNYTTIANHCLQNQNLSNKARGLLCTMLSLHPKWDFSVEGLARICKDGKDGIKTQLDELEKCKYLRRGGRIRNEKGQLKEAEFTIYEVPYDELPATGTPMQEFPPLGFPMLGFPAQENPTQLNTYISNTNELNTNSINSSSLSYSQMLEERRRWKELIEERLEYDLLRNQKGMELLDVVINAMVSVICSKNPKIKIRGDEYEQAYVKEKFLTLDEYHVTYVLDVYDDNKAHVKCTSAYFIPLLFEAPEKADDYYAALYNRDHS